MKEKGERLRAWAEDMTDRYGRFVSEVPGFPSALAQSEQGFQADHDIVEEGFDPLPLAVGPFAPQAVIKPSTWNTSAPV